MRSSLIARVGIWGWGLPSRICAAAFEQAKARRCFPGLRCPLSFSWYRQHCWPTASGFKKSNVPLYSLSGLVCALALSVFGKHNNIGNIYRGNVFLSPFVNDKSLLWYVWLLWSGTLELLIRMVWFCESGLDQPVLNLEVLSLSCGETGFRIYPP